MRAVCVYSPFRHLDQDTLTGAHSHHRSVLDVLRMRLKLLDCVVQAIAGSACYSTRKTEALRAICSGTRLLSTAGLTEGCAGPGQSSSKGVSECLFGGRLSRRFQCDPQDLGARQGGSGGFAFQAATEQNSSPSRG